MTNDNRIVPGGELDLGQSTLDDALAETKMPPAQPIAQVVDFGSKNTLGDRLVNYLRNALLPNDLIDRTIYGPRERKLTEKIPETHDLVGSPSFEKIIRTLGPTALGFVGFGYLNCLSNSSIYDDLTRNQVTVIRLDVNQKINGLEFGKLVKALLGEEGGRYFMSTDLAIAIGANDATRQIELGNQSVLNYFPDLRRLQSLRGEYITPNDPFIFLMGLKPESRRLLSAAFDVAVDKKEFPFPNGFQTYSSKATINDYISTMANTRHFFDSGLVSLGTLIAVAQQYGVKEIKPYLDDIAQLRDKFEKAPLRDLRV